MATQTTTSSTKRSKLEDTYNYATPSNQGGIQKLSEYKNIVNQNQSALSSLQGAKEQALKAADVSALAQGYGTQGAYQQNIGNIQSAYLNRVGQQQQVAQQQIGALQDVASTNAFQNFSTALANAEAQGTLNTDQLNTLQNAYFNQMNASDLANARLLIDQYNRNIAQESTGNVYEGTIPNGRNYYVDIAQITENPNSLPNIAIDGKSINTNNLVLADEVSLTQYDKVKDMEIGEIRLIGDSAVIKMGDGKVRMILAKNSRALSDYENFINALRNKSGSSTSSSSGSSSSSATNVGSNYKNALREEFEKRNKK